MRVIYLDLDSTRADHLGCYGYHRATSPNIDRISRDAVRFTNCYCSDAPCMPSRTAFMGGRFGINSGVVGHDQSGVQMKLWPPELRGFSDPLRAHSLPARFRQAGYKTALFSPFGERHSAYHFYAGFNEMYNTGKGGMEVAQDVTPGVLRWLEQNGKDDNWYIHINYWDPHSPFRTPPEFGSLFQDEPLPAWLTGEVFASHLEKTGPHSALDLQMYHGTANPRFPRQPGHLASEQDLRQQIDEYDTAIRYTDTHVGQILHWLDQQGLYEDTAIIVSADHGENQGELGIYSEHGTADQATCRIPMIVKWPGGQRGTVDEALHYNLDWLPTVAELLEQDPWPYWDGQSYARTLLDGTPLGHDALVIGQLCHVCQRSVRWGDYLYIRTYFDGFHLFPPHMLFNLREDPHEQHNLAEARPDLVNEAVARLTDWHDRQMTRSFDGIDPLWHVLREYPAHARPQRDLPGYLLRLQNTGRREGADRLRHRFPELPTSPNP